MYRRVWDAYSGNCNKVFPHSHIVRAVDLSANGKQLATGGYERRLRVYDLSNYDAEPRIFRRRGAKSEQDAHDGTIKAVVWDDSGKSIASIGEDKTLRLWDVRTGEVANERTFTDMPTSLARNRDGSLSLTCEKEVHFLTASEYVVIFLTEKFSKVLIDLSYLQYHNSQITYIRLYTVMGFSTSWAESQPLCHRRSKRRLG